MGTPDLSTMAEAMNRIWARHLPELEERVATLETAAAAAAEDRLNPELCEQAASAAHKLAGVLGTFGLHEGTVLAREAESLYATGPQELPDARLVTLASQLRAVLASRKG